MKAVSILGLFGFLLLVGCGETQHPVRTETQSPSVATTGSEEGSPVPNPHGSGGHPPMMSQGGAMSGIPGMEAPSGPAPQGPIVDLGGVQMTAPDAWVRKQPKFGMISAEFALPGAEGAGDGRLTVMSAGGSVDENIKRWQGQFQSDAEQKPAEKFNVGEYEVTLVDLTGSFQGGMFGQSQTLPNQRMFGAIVPIQGTLFFIKATGPDATLGEHEEAFRGFLDTLGQKPDAGTPASE